MGSHDERPVANVVLSPQHSHLSPGFQRQKAGNPTPPRPGSPFSVEPSLSGTLFQGNDPGAAEGVRGSADTARTTDAQLQTACHRRPAGKPRGADQSGRRRRPVGSRARQAGRGGAGEPGRREGPAAGAGHGASPEAEPSRPHPTGALPGGSAPNPPLSPRRALPVGDPPRDLVMQDGYDLQRVSANARVPATVRVCTRPCWWVRGRVGVWACVGVLGRVPSDM